MTHLCTSKLTIIGSDNGLSPDRRQAIIWTNVGIVLIRTLGTNFSEILGKTHSFSIKKMHFKMSSAKGHLGLNELMLRLTMPGSGHWYYHRLHWSSATEILILNMKPQWVNEPNRMYFSQLTAFLSCLVLLNRISFALIIVNSAGFFLIIMIGTEHRSELTHWLLKLPISI